MPLSIRTYQIAKASKLEPTLAVLVEIEAKLGILPVAVVLMTVLVVGPLPLPEPVAGSNPKSCESLTGKTHFCKIRFM